MLPEIEGAVGEEAWRLREFCRSLSQQISLTLRAVISADDVLVVACRNKTYATPER